MTNPHILKCSRLEALTDGIFAIAMTILILNVVLPDGVTSATLWQQLKSNIFHKLFIYVGSFIILGTYWVGMDFQHGFLYRITRSYLWLNILLLMFACVVPFSASLLARFPHEIVSFYFFTINLIIISLLESLIWTFAQHFDLNNAIAHTKEVNHSIYWRVLIAPLCYFIALGLAWWNAEIAFILLVIPPLLHISPGMVDRYTVEENKLSN